VYYGLDLANCRHLPGNDGIFQCYSDFRKRLQIFYVNDEQTIQVEGNNHELILSKVLIQSTVSYKCI
jgi:hypothetical protein